VWPVSLTVVDSIQPTGYYQRIGGICDVGNRLEKSAKKRVQDNMTPDEYEIGVKNVIAAKGGNLQDFKVTLKEAVAGSDGEYEIDVVARFSVFDGAEIVVLIECKHHKNSIKRELVQVLHSKLGSVGANKAMMFTTANYQRGAIEFAQEHGISLVIFRESEMKYAVKAILTDAVEVSIDEDGNTAYTVLCEANALMN